MLALSATNLSNGTHDMISAHNTTTKGMNCPACGVLVDSRGRQEFVDPISKKEYHLHRCPACTIEFWSPLEMPPSSYYEEAEADYVEFHGAGSRIIRWWHRSFLDHFPRAVRPGRILDIGCADGRFLYRMKQLGWEIHGIDLDRLSVQTARRNCETDTIDHCTLQEYMGRADRHSFDLITFFEVLEHQPNPVEFMNQVKTLLKPGGMIGGSVPNRDRYIVPRRFAPDNPPHHFTLWTAPILKEFLTRNGFLNLEHHFVRYEPHLLDQLMQHVAYARVSQLKLQMGVKSFASKPGREADLRARLISGVKRFIWKPLVQVIGLAEYPFILATRKSISIQFRGVWSEGVKTSEG